MRILVIEDDPNLNNQIKQSLEDSGYSVDFALDGEEGHFLGDTEPYDAVILDLGLPKVDGISVLERWRKEKKNFPVLILTSPVELILSCSESLVVPVKIEKLPALSVLTVALETIAPDCNVLIYTPAPAPLLLVQVISFLTAPVP